MARNRQILARQNQGQSAAQNQLGHQPGADGELPARGTGLLGTRAEAAQRLKVGVGGLMLVLLVVALASSVLQMTRDAEDGAVAAPETQAAEESGSDPLVDIGVAPELPGDQPVVQDLPAAQMPPETLESGQPSDQSAGPAAGN